MDIVRDVTLMLLEFQRKRCAGNPSPVTAYGVIVGMKAAAKNNLVLMF
jgi:leucine dehydrogenase